MSIKACALLAAGAAALVGMSGCNRSQSGDSGQGAAAVADRGAGQGYAASTGGAGGSGYGASHDARGGGRRYGGNEDEARPPAPLFHGEPMWSENRSHSAQENAEYHFERAGADLGSHTLDDFLTKVHRFCDHPPAGTLSLSRQNGDRLLYEPKSNLFAVVTREGAPRTVFKPSDGMAYWNEQKTRLAEGGGDRGSGYGRRRSYGGDEGGGYGGRSRRYGSDRDGGDRTDP